MISCYLGVAILLVGWIKLLTIDSGLPKMPESPNVWLSAIFVAVLGVVQQFCIIGKHWIKQSCFYMLCSRWHFLVTAAVKKGSPVQVSMIRTLQIALGFALQSQSEDIIAIYPICGAALIVTTAFLMMAERRITSELKSAFNRCCRKGKNQAI